MNMIHQQKSFEGEEHKGILYLVPTPIGNLEDMTFRAIRLMKESDVIAAEDTRNTKKLCNYFEIHTPIVSYHEHNKEQSAASILARLQKGEKVALVSDAGMPSISDPGYELVVAAINEELTVVPLPGANAALTALIASGLPPQPFYFYGFLPRGKKEKKEQLGELKHQSTTFILYESPHRLKETLKFMLEVIGNRQIVLCRELTKRYEEFLRGDLESALKWASEYEVRGEFCIIVEGNENEIESSSEEWWTGLTIPEHVDMYVEKQQLTSKEAVKQTALDRNIPKREVYQLYHVE
jgi:16S rRNA (cytidine1402-2'-O)-methyltransferase